jgi:hypothetical protein
MSLVICPNCRAIVTYTARCSNCKLSFQALLGEVIETAAGPTTETTMAAETAVKSKTSVKAGVMPDMDPALQWYSVKLAEGVRKLKTASTANNEVAVIAKVEDKKFTVFDDLIKSVKGSVGLRIDPNPQDIEEEKTSIVTARIPMEFAEHVRKQNFVKSLKASRRLKSTLFRTISDVKADALPGASLADGGSGVIIGIVDIGFNFFHEKFRNKDEDHTTRVLSFWNQSADPIPKSGELGAKGPFGYGRVFSQDEINTALKADNPFERLGYRLTVTGIERDGVHATPVADIAAGNDRGRLNQFHVGNPGIAPKADIVFVELSSSGIAGANPVSAAASFGSDVLEASFADSAQLLEAIAYIFNFAQSRKQPCVVNVSLGTNGGPHDGSTPVEEAMDRLVSEAPNRAIVIAAGNFSTEQTHMSGTVSAEPFLLKWQVQQNDPTGNELEIWYEGDDFLNVEIIAPGGNRVTMLDAGENINFPITDDSNLFAVHRIQDPNNEANLINLFLEKGATPGIWAVRLSRSSAKDSAKDVDFHAWIERDHKGRSVFVNPNSDVTLSSIACGQKTIVVGAYDAHTGDPSRKILPSSSSGPTRPGYQKPDISAPGVGIKAASFEGKLEKDAQAVFPVDGTSMASAVVTGVVALMLDEARKHKLDLDIDQIRSILIDASKSGQTDAEEWDKQLGHGRISASRAVEMVLEMASNND